MNCQQKGINVKIVELINAFVDYKTSKIRYFHNQIPDIGEFQIRFYKALVDLYINTKPFLIKSAKKQNKIYLIKILDILVSVKDNNTNIKEMSKYLREGGIVSDLLELLEDAGIYKIP